MCGEKAIEQQKGGVIMGSPPRVRGKAALSGSRSQDGRITPACAGKSCSSLLSSTFWWDHPRVCGEKKFCVDYCNLGQGSPPRVRGKVTWTTAASKGPRITPACAGKSMMHSRNGRKVKDHPRVCGEKLMLMAVLMPSLGSPPRVRGKAKRRQ